MKNYDGFMNDCGEFMNNCDGFMNDCDGFMKNYKEFVCSSLIKILQKMNETTAMLLLANFTYQ